MDDNIKKLHQALIDDGYDDVGTEQEFRDYVSDSKNVATLYNALSEAGYDNFKDQKSLETYLSAKAPVAQKPSTPQSSGQSASVENKPRVAQPAAKPQTEYPQEVLDAYNSPDNKPGNFKDLAQLNDEYQRGELKKPSLISQALGMMPKVDAGNIGKEQKVGGMIANMLLGDNIQQPQQTQQPLPSNTPPQEPSQFVQMLAEQQQNQTLPQTKVQQQAQNEGLMDAKLANYLENWKQRPDKQGTYFENMVADLLADGTANSNEEAVKMVQSALGRYANRSAMDVTNQVVSSLPDDTVQDAEKSIEAQWYSHGVQDKLKQEADSMGISYDDYVAQFLKPAMVQSLVNKYGPNYRNIAEGIATRLYAHDEHVQDRLMNQDINDALSSVINKYVNPSVVDEYNKAQEAGSKAFTEGMEGSQYIPANLRLGTALGAQYEENEAKDPAKVLSGLQKKFSNLYRNPEFLNDMSNAAFKVMQRYGLDGGMSGDPKQFKPMINSVLKNELDQLEIKGMMPKGSAEYIMKTGLGNTIVGKITRKAMQTDYQNWLEDIANQQYQPGFWENVASGSLTFAGDAWSYWLPGAAGGKLTKSMLAKAEGRLAGDLMAKGMESRMAARAAKLLIGKSKSMALKSGAVHGAVTFGGQSVISKPIDEKYRTGQFDENGKIYNPSGWKIALDTLLEGGKQSALGVIMQGNTIANMIGKGRGLATNILADIGGKVVDSGIMTGHQMLERMAQDPNFKPTGKDAAESFLESMANLTAIGLPGMVGKYARFKDAREFNKKYDFTNQDIADLKRFDYDGLRDAFEKVGIGEYAVEGENAQRLDGQLTQKYMNLMNDKSVPEVLKAKMMAVVEGKRPSSFSPVVDSVIVQPMDNGGKVYLETLNKDGGIIERKEYSSLDEAQKADKKLEYEKTLGLASVLEGEFHNEFTQEHLDGLYNQAAQKYNMGEKLTDEDKAAVYLHQNAGAIKEIMDKQQKGIILTEEEQKQVDTYRHFYNSALENSSVMREFVNTFEDSHGVTRGTLRKALESKDKKYAPLVESYLKELYNSIELKREMKQTMDDLYNTAHGNEQKRIEQSGIEGEKPAAPVEDAAPVEGTSSVEGAAGGQEPPVSAGPAPYQERTNSVPSPSDANSAANVANSSAEVAASDAFVMGQEAYKNGDSGALQAIDYNSDLATGRLKRAFADSDTMFDLVTKAYNEGRDMEQFVAQRAGNLTPAQKEAIGKYVEAMDAKKGAIDALQHADDGYGDALKEQLWPYQTEDGNIVPATLTSGKQVFLKKANEYGGGFVVVPDEQGQPTIKQVSNAEIKEVGTPVSLDEYIESSLAQQKESRAQQFISQFDGSGLKPNDRVTVAMEEGDANIDMTFAGYSEDGKIVLTDGKDYLPLSKEEFDTWRTNALNNTINERLDREDSEREMAELKQAEADKQERYKKGIFGYAAGQPDYSDTQTDPKVAAEYLQETAGEDRKALFANIVAEKQALQKRINQLRDHIASNEEWLSINADLDPKNAETRTLANKQMEGQIADLQARFDNWNKIRSAVMTPEEAQAIKADRTQKIADAGVNEGDVAPIEGREVAVLGDEELKKQYPTMDEASNFIASERKRIYRIQSDEVQREIDGVDEVLDRYVNGEIDLEPEQIKELNTTKAQLQARQANLTESAKDLKAQADKLKTLYRKENMEARAKAVEDMTPAEQRAIKVENAIKNGNMNQLNSIYEDVRGATDFNDTEPNTLEEYVANNIGRFTLNYEGKEKGGAFSNGIQQETGLGRKDFDKLQILAKEGEGKTVPEFVHSLYDDMPMNLKQMGYTDHDIRSAFLDLIGSAQSYSDIKNYTLNNKVANVEQLMRDVERQEEMKQGGESTENIENAPFADRLQNAIAETETEPTEAQKKAGNYKKGHLTFGGYNFTVETPKGVTRSGKDEQGKPWSVTMHDTYGYILGKIGVDGDHIDMFINDAADLDTFDGNVCVIDQVNPETGEFDEHKVMYGFPEEAAATKAYLSNYSKGWKGLGKVTSVPKATFDKWLESSDRKTKPFREYAMIQQEEAKKAKEAKESLPFDAPMNMDDLPFHRDVKEVKPSEMTEAQKVAYDAVSTMLKKAGIPVKVVSNEDMEKVAEAQDNLNLAMLLNHPEMRFKIKTPEEKQAAENAYNFAKELRPNKWAQYAVVDMSNPNKMPEYYPKQELARKERTYLNRLMWGNYKVFNLDKSFEDNVAGLAGSFPSEFDPYKIDEQTNKRNELKKQIKETEEAYKLTGQERVEYQNHLMKEYMDEHGLASENDIPDDVWNDCRNKSFEKYQDKLDSLFAKYKDLDRQLKSVAEPGVQYLKGKGVVYGYTDGKEIVLNQEHLNPNTPIHEYQHLWRTAAKEMNPELIAHGDELIKQTQLFRDLKEDPNYKHLSDDEICDEAFARLTGEDGAAILEQMAKDAIKENPLDTAKELTIINRLKNWLKKFWYWTLDTFTKWKPEDIKKMTLEDIRNLVLRDLANGVDPRNVKSRMTKEEAVSLRKQMADNAEQERILEHTKENWLKEFGKDSRVTTPIGSIKLGENQYKKAGRNDRIKRFGLLKPTLERPDVILEKSAPKEGAERQTKYLFIKSFKKSDGNKILNYESITVKQDEEEVAISAHQIDPSKVVKELTESKVLWNRFRGDSNSLGENQGSALTPSANNPSGKDSVLNPHSDAKIRNNIETAKGNDGNLSVEDKIKAVSQQFGVDEADVAMYANAVKKGSTAEAARARANIKRHLLQANEDKISSLKELLKYTVPVNNALKENFGDLDAMIEERKQQVEAQRNAMEAARKRAEEEEAKRQKHLEELSVIPDDQLDKQYMDALAKGDDATAREMLDEAARRKGYDDTESAYQGVGAWAAPGNPGYESDKARRDDWESSGSDVNLEDMALGYTPQPDDYFSHPERYSQNTPHGLESVKAINTAIDAIKNGEKDVKVKVYRAVPTSVKEGKLRNGDWVTPSKKYAEMHGANRLEGKYRIIEDEVPASQLWWDGNDANEFGFDDGKEYKYKNAKNNRKLNDLVTYDDEGDVIPPSKRFNSRKSDIRFMFAGEKGAAEADKAEEKTYRMDNLKVAEKMERGKKDAKAIKLATGWERGADGKWRYEMPDAKIKDMKDIGGGHIVKRFDDDMLWNSGKLADVIDAPGLFEAYPKLKDVRIDTDEIMNDMPSNGVYNAKTNTITIHADELKYMNSILNHEIQHAIQYIEGFAKGGSPEQMEKEFKAAQDEWKARAYAHELEEKAKEMGGEYNQSEVEKALVEEYKDLDMTDELPDKETRIKGFNYFARGYADRSMDDAIKRFRLNESTRSDFDSYKEYLKLAGEVESRNVEKRLGMTDEERRNSLAEETEDVNRDEQIVMNGNDASYSIVKDPETIKKLDKEDTVKVYRAMQVGEDGKLYPPMAAKVKGKFVEPIELGKWEQADERPELADDKGMFTLNKGNGKSLKAAYNPYLHTSRTPLNDQFSEAQNRPNIVTVEVEVPKSELTSGYKADKAKDAVGEVEWKAGIIQGQLTGKRKVVLSRWDKPVRIVPDSEVADVIVNDMFKGKNITMPSNVVTPSLRKELEKRGVPFVETDNRGRIVGGENDGVHYSKVYGKNHREKGYRSILKFSLGDNGTDVADGNGDSKNKNPNKNVITRRIGSREQAQRRVNETLGAAASDLQRSLGATAKEQRPTWNRRSALGYVRRRAEELSSLLTEKDLKEIQGGYIGHGQENYVYQAKYDDKKVIKFNDFSLTDSLFRINEFIDRVNAHNQFQPKDKYTPIGFAYDEKGDFCIVMEQPYLKGTQPTREEITQYLTDHGFKLDMIQISADEVDLGWTNGEFDLWDAEPRNVIKDENGDLHFFDTMIQHTYIPNHKNPLRLSMPSIRTFESQEMNNSADKVKNVANVLGGAEAVTYTSSADVPEEYRVAIEQGAKGWYDPTTHTVHVYLPNCADANEAQRTVFHEKIGHEGMEVLLGGEDEVRKFANFVYNSVAASTRGKILEIANEYDPDWKKHDRMNVGTQEYIARLAEEGPKTAEDFSLWTKIKHYLIRVLKKLGIRVPGLLNDKDLRYYLMKAGKALHVWDNMPKEKQEAMMKQASNAEIKDSLGEGAKNGKPRQKKGESMVQYMKRVQEWRKWKNAREDENDPEPPMFYDIDKDEAGKKEWAQLNKDWRERHHLAGEEPMGMPIRMEGEEDGAYMTRIHEYEKWKDAMKDQEDPMPDMFSFEKKKQEEVKRKYEDWLARHELLEQQQADLDLYEGKIYPAETNPKADDLEQQVMQDLAEVTSTDVSKEGAARSVHDAVIYRRKNIESASADDAIFINSVKQELNKMANASYLGRKADAIADAVKETVTGKSPKTQAKKMAEAIPYIIEAPRRMRDIADEMNAVGAFENGHIHVTAKDIDAIQPFTDELRTLASKSHKIEKDGKETIVYDDVPSMTEVASKMAKAINDNHVGEEGFVPVDGTDILAEHVLPVVLKRIVPEGIEYKNLSEEMQSLLDKIREWYDKTFTWLKDSHTVREDIGYTKDYVNHRWDKEKSDDKAYADLVEGRQRTKSPNEKPRKVSTYMEGVDAGLVPKTTDITDLLAYYSQSNIEAFANKTFLQELSGINVIERNKDGEITSSMPLLSNIQPKEMMVDENKYTPYVVPGINTVWVYNQGKIFNKSAEDWFNAAFGTVKLPKVLKGIKNAMSMGMSIELCHAA